MAGGARRGSGHCRLLVMAVVMRVARRVVLLMVAVVLLLLLVAGLGAVKLARRQVVAVALAHLRRTASLHPARRGRSWKPALPAARRPRPGWRPFPRAR